MQRQYRSPWRFGCCRSCSLLGAASRGCLAPDADQVIVSDRHQVARVGAEHHLVDDWRIGAQDAPARRRLLLRSTATSCLVAHRTLGPLKNLRIQSGRFQSQISRVERSNIARPSFFRHFSMSSRVPGKAGWGGRYGCAAWSRAWFSQRRAFWSPRVANVRPFGARGAFHSRSTAKRSPDYRRSAPSRQLHKREPRQAYMKTSTPYTVLYCTFCTYSIHTSTILVCIYSKLHWL